MEGFGSSVGVEEEGTVSRGSDNVIHGGAEQHQAVLVLSISGGKKGGGSVGGAAANNRQMCSRRGAKAGARGKNSEAELLRVFRGCELTRGPPQL